MIFLPLHLSFPQSGMIRGSIFLLIYILKGGLPIHRWEYKLVKYFSHGWNDGRHPPRSTIKSFWGVREGSRLTTSFRLSNGWRGWGWGWSHKELGVVGWDYIWLLFCKPEILVEKRSIHVWHEALVISIFQYSGCFLIHGPRTEEIYYFWEFENFPSYKSHSFAFLFRRGGGAWGSLCW